VDHISQVFDFVVPVPPIGIEILERVASYSAEMLKSVSQWAFPQDRKSVCDPDGVAHGRIRLRDGNFLNPGDPAVHAKQAP